MANILDFSAKLDNYYYHLDATKSAIYLYISLKAGEAPEKKERAPLNISLVLDRSGSMEGDKLKYVKKATNFVIDNLNQEDFISIIQYDDKIELVSKSGHVTHKDTLKKKVNGIRARGTTNMSGGMMEGYKQVKSTMSKGYINRMLLLSDGLANAGVTTPEKLQAIVQKAFRSDNVAISTFGVGADFNENLMTNLAEYGGANYYFIETPDEIPNIFAKELSGLLSVVAQNAKLKINYPSSCFKLSKVYGYMASNEEEGVVEVNFNDVFSAEEKAVLIKFDITQEFTTVQDFQINLSYDDVAVRLTTIEEMIKLALKPTDDMEQYNSKVDKTITAQIAFFVSNDMLEQSIKYADDRNFEAAKKTIAQAKTYLEAHFEHIVPSDELKNQLKSINDYAKRLEDMEGMGQMEYQMSQKFTKSMNYTLRKKRK